MIKWWFKTTNIYIYIYIYIYIIFIFFIYNINKEKYINFYIFINNYSIKNMIGSPNWYLNIKIFKNITI